MNVTEAKVLFQKANNELTVAHKAYEVQTRRYGMAGVDVLNRLDKAYDLVNNAEAQLIYAILAAYKAECARIQAGAIDPILALLQCQKGQVP